MTDQTLDDIFDDIEREYGKKPVDKNVEFILSLFAKHIKDAVLSGKAFYEVYGVLKTF